MSKKQFASSFQDIFSPTETTSEKQEIVPISEDKDEILRTTLLLSKKTYDTIKAIAFWERTQIKEVVQDALISYINSKEKDQLEKVCSEYKKHYL